MKQEFDRGSHHLKRCLHVWQTQNNYLLFFFSIIFSWFGLCVFLHRSSLWWESLDGENFFLSIPFCWERNVKQATDPTFLKTEVNDPAIWLFPLTRLPHSELLYTFYCNGMTACLLWRQLELFSNKFTTYTEHMCKFHFLHITFFDHSFTDCLSGQMQASGQIRCSYILQTTWDF